MTHERDIPTPDGTTNQPTPSSRGISRKEFLRSAASTGVAVAAGGSFLAGCGGGSSGTTTSTSVGKPRYGGSFKIGLIGGGSAESLNPANADDSIVNITRCYLLYDTLTRITPESTVAPGLAEEWMPSNGYRTWTFKIRPNVKFHDGRPLTSADLLYSFKYMAKSTNNASVLLTNVNINGITAPDNRTLIVPLHGPQILFPLVLTDPACAIIPSGTTDFTHPVGTGAFKYVSFSPGQQSVFARNHEYWDDGKPYVDQVVMTSINDDTARINALLSGTINILVEVPYTQGHSLASNSAVKLVRITSNTPYLFYMRVDEPPFNDVRVRTAMKDLVDRPGLIADALNGFGEVANDLVGKGLTFYDAGLPQRTQDVNQARSLLKSAGHSGLAATLYSSAINPGIPEAATLFAQQAAAAGVKISIRTVPADAYFNTSLQYLKYPFASSYWVLSSIPQWYGEALGPGAPYNETHYQNPRFSKLLAEANGASSTALATELWAEVQKMQYEEGGYIVWANVDNLDAVAPTVENLTPGRPYPIGAPTGLINAWLSA